MRAINVSVLIFVVLASLSYIGISLFVYIDEFIKYQSIETDLVRSLVFIAFFTFIAQLVLGVMVEQKQRFLSNSTNFPKS